MFYLPKSKSQFSVGLVIKGSSSVMSSFPHLLASSPPALWQDGPLEVRSFTIAADDFESPTVTDIHYPTATLTRFEYPVYIFHHGFLSQPEDYRTLLRRLASHGVITIAPRAYSRMSGLMTSIKKEVSISRKVRRWIYNGGIAKAISADGGTARPASDLPPALGGHSRGGGIAFLSSETVMRNEPAPLIIATVDPVDASASPFTKSSTSSFRHRYKNGTVAPCSLLIPQHTPIVTVSAELGGACTPEGKGPKAFHSAAGAPALIAQVTNAGHFDLAFDDTNHWMANLVRTTAEFKCKTCTGDTCRAKARDTSAAVILLAMREAIEEVRTHDISHDHLGISGADQKTRNVAFGADHHKADGTAARLASFRQVLDQMPSAARQGIEWVARVPTGEPAPRTVATADGCSLGKIESGTADAVEVVQVASHEDKKAPGESRTVELFRVPAQPSPISVREVHEGRLPSTSTAQPSATVPTLLARAGTSAECLSARVDRMLIDFRAAENCDKWQQAGGGTLNFEAMNEVSAEGLRSADACRVNGEIPGTGWLPGEQGQSATALGRDGVGTPGGSSSARWVFDEPLQVANVEALVLKVNSRGAPAAYRLALYTQIPPLLASTSSTGMNSNIAEAALKEHVYELCFTPSTQVASEHVLELAEFTTRSGGPPLRFDQVVEIGLRVHAPGGEECPRIQQYAQKPLVTPAEDTEAAFELHLHTLSAVTRGCDQLVDDEPCYGTLISALFGGTILLLIGCAVCACMRRTRKERAAANRLALRHGKSSRSATPSPPPTTIEPAAAASS